jgi:hypothetical protein
MEEEHVRRQENRQLGKTVKAGEARTAQLSAWSNWKDRGRGGDDQHWKGGSSETVQVGLAKVRQTPTPPKPSLLRHTPGVAADPREEYPSSEPSMVVGQATEHPMRPHPTHIRKQEEINVLRQHVKANKKRQQKVWQRRAVRGGEEEYFAAMERVAKAKEKRARRKRRQRRKKGGKKPRAWGARSWGRRRRSVDSIPSPRSTSSIESSFEVPAKEEENTGDNIWGEVAGWEMPEFLEHLRRHEERRKVGHVGGGAAAGADSVSGKKQALRVLEDAKLI